jgi:hypothetical protein
MVAAVVAGLPGGFIATAASRVGAKTGHHAYGPSPVIMHLNLPRSEARLRVTNCYPLQNKHMA